MKFYQWMVKEYGFRNTSLGVLIRRILNTYRYYEDFPKPGKRSRLRLRRFLLKHDSKLRGIEIFDEMYNMYFNRKENAKWMERKMKQFG